MSIVDYNDKEALKRAWRQLQVSLEFSGSTKDAKNVEAHQITTIPMTILGVTSNKSGSTSVVAILGPYTCFDKLQVDISDSRSDDGRRIISVTEDSRSKETKAQDKTTNRNLSNDKIHDADKVAGVYDPDGNIRMVRKDFVEGDSIRLLDESGGSEIKPGSVCACAIQSMIWHKVADKKVSVVFKIKRILDTIAMPIDSFVNWIVSEDLATRHFETDIVDYLQFLNENPTASDTDRKNASYSDRQLTIVTGLPNDYTHPHFMRPNTSLLQTEIDADDKESFMIKDKNGSYKIMLAFRYKGMQWYGARATPECEPDDTLFAIYATVYEEDLQEFNVSHADNWWRLMAPVGDMLKGVYMGKENCDKGSRAEYNATRITCLSAKSWNAKRDEFNGPTGDKSLSFGMHMVPSAYVVDVVSFLISVGPCVSAKKIIECWGGKTKPPRINDLPLKAVDKYKMVICLSEVSPNTDLAYILNDPNYEFRVLTSAAPMKNRFRREIYEMLSALDVKHGDEFLDYLYKCVHTNDDEYLERTESEGGISDDHFVRKSDYQFSDKAKVVYFFAINRHEWQHNRDAGLEQMKALGLLGRPENKRQIEGNDDDDDDDVPVTKRQKMNEDEVPLAVDDDDDDDGPEDGLDLF